MVELKNCGALDHPRSSVKPRISSSRKCCELSKQTLGEGILSSEGEGMDTQPAWVAVSPLCAKSIHSGDIRVHSYSLVKVYLTTFGTGGDILFQVDLWRSCSSQRIGSICLRVALNPHVVHSMDCKPHGTYEPLLLDDFYRSVA